MNISKEEIDQTKKGILVDIGGRRNLLVSFGGIQQGLGIPVFEFFKSISNLDCDKVFLRDFQQAWYQKGVDDEIDAPDRIIGLLEEVINLGNYKKVCFVGNSMGGYAAILFGSILNIDKVIAFAPQSYIDKWTRFLTRDNRWARQIDSLHSYPKKRNDFFDLKRHLKKVGEYKTVFDIFYSPKDRLDKKHAERLRNVKKINLHPIAEGGHSVVKIIRDKGELISLIQSAFKE